MTLPRVLGVCSQLGTGPNARADSRVNVEFNEFFATYSPDAFAEVQARVGGRAYSRAMTLQLPRYAESGMTSRTAYPPRDVDLFAALAEPARRRIVDILASGEHTAGELAALVGSEFRISRTAVSKHLRILRDAELVDVRAELRWRWYFLTESGVKRLERVVADLRTKFEGGVGWDSGLRAKRDPLHGIPDYGRSVRRKGRGRDLGLGRRGRQSVPPVASEPDYGLFPMFAPPEDPDEPA
jgi:DNA-binding transcriptional ArsR family regulator